MIVWLDEPVCQERRLTGGKAASLSRMAAHYPVPPGFCVTTEAYEAFAATVSANDEALAPLRTAVATAYNALADRMLVTAPRVAVRSSAVAEDGYQASFAGQYETYLNVAGIDDVMDAIVCCWRSAQAQGVLAYQSGLAPALQDSSLAVLVQTLVPADASFVAFSANPITGNRAEVVINASWGLGESVVGGTVTPDTYTLQKSAKQNGAWTIADYTLADKERMTITTQNGVRAVKIPRAMRTKPAIKEIQARDIAQLTAGLEAEMGWPVDVEGAYQADALYLLQCRPISTLR